MGLIEIDGKKPRVDKTAYVDPQATLIGDVVVEKKVGIWPGAVIRGDEAKITLKEGCMVLENAVIEAAGGRTTVIGSRSIISHGAIVHGACINNACVIGIGAIVLDGAVVGNNSIIGSAALVAPGKKIPDKQLVLGIPGKIVRELTNKDIANSSREWELLNDKVDKYRKTRMNDS